MPKMGELSAKQRRFIDCYNGNAAAAAIAAGYSKKNAKVIAGQLMKRPEIAAAIRAREQKRSAENIATREERQRFFTAVMRNSEQGMKDRLRAAELLGKSEGDFLDRHEFSGADGQPITVHGLLQELEVRYVDDIRDTDGNMINPDVKPLEYAQTWLLDFYNAHYAQTGKTYTALLDDLRKIGREIDEA